MVLEHLAYGVVIKKNADIKHLTEQVALAQNRVAEQQAIVDSLQAKSSFFTTQLALATTNKASTLVNYNLARDAVISVNGLASNLGMARKQIGQAVEGAADVSERMANLIGKLIFSVEIVTKVTQLINKQKALNPLLPDSLVAFMSKATSDANNAVALTLTALQSCYAAESTLLESGAVIDVTDRQAHALKERMESGIDPLSATSGTRRSAADLTASDAGILLLLKQAYDNAVTAYNDALADSDNVAAQLSYAQTQSALASMKLGSVQAGLKAATAAAYAA